MILSDKGIHDALKKGFISIEPFQMENLQPASYDLHMSDTIMYFNKKKATVIDVKQSVTEMMDSVVLKDNEPYVLYPGDFILSGIKEVTGVDNQHVGRLEGKSSLARLGLIIHATAGFLDPGNCLSMTLEIHNLNILPIKIYAGMKIAQMAFEQLDQPCDKPYGHKSLNSKYHRDSKVKESMMHKNFYAPTPQSQ